MTRDAVQVHGVALALALDADGPLFGVLLLGRSGAGKSALALEAIEACPWRRTRLVADDRVDLFVEDGRLTARPPARLEGLIEVRGVGPVRVATAQFAPIRLAASLDGPFERTPERAAYAPGNLAAAPRSPPTLLPFDVARPPAAARLRQAARSILVDK